VFNSQNQILVGLRNFRYSPPNYWQFPQGGIDSEEPLVTAAKRELTEETSIYSCTAIAVSQHTSSYHWSQGRRRLWLNPLKYSGQNQRIVYWRFTGPGSEIKVDDDELADFKWIQAGELRQVVHTERQALVDIVLRDIKEGKILEQPEQ